MTKTKQQSVSPIVAIIVSKDVERVKAKIHDRYGFRVTDEYARDLIAFVNALTVEMVD